MEGVPSGNNYQGGFGTQLMAKVSSTSSSRFPVSPSQESESIFKELICDIMISL